MMNNSVFYNEVMENENDYYTPVDYEREYYGEMTEDDWHALRGNSERRYTDAHTRFGRLLAKAGEEFRAEYLDLDYFG